MALTKEQKAFISGKIPTIENDFQHTIEFFKDIKIQADKLTDRKNSFLGEFSFFGLLFSILISGMFFLAFISSIKSSLLALIITGLYAALLEFLIIKYCSSLIFCFKNQKFNTDKFNQFLLPILSVIGQDADPSVPMVIKADLSDKNSKRLSKKEIIDSGKKYDYRTSYIENNWFEAKTVNRDRTKICLNLSDTEKYKRKKRSTSHKIKSSIKAAFIIDLNSYKPLPEDFKLPIKETSVGLKTEGNRQKITVKTSVSGGYSAENLSEESESDFSERVKKCIDIIAGIYSNLELAK